MKAKRDLLSTLCAAVAAKYKNEGDRIQAGVVISQLSFDPPRFYASVCRYRGSYTNKEVVCRVGIATVAEHDEAFPDAEKAVEALALKWYKQTVPAPEKDALSELGEALGK